MTMLQRCLEFLNQQRIPYALTSHPIAYTARGVAEAEHLSAHKLAKTVIYLGDYGYGMAVVPADRYLDLAKLKRVTRSRRLRLATEVELGELFTESELGAMPPLGNLFDMPVFFDESLAQEEFIAFNAGTHHDVIHMSSGDFRRIVGPAIASFATRFAEMATTQ